VICGGGCVDPMTDPGNCGSCGHACVAGQICSGGICCASGQSNCGGACTDTTTSTTDCGGCGVACAGGQACCNGVCSTLGQDANHCGACGASCGCSDGCLSGACAALDTTGLVLYLKMDEGSGTTAADSSGNAHTGTLNGPTWVPGRIGDALGFDGIDDYVSLANPLTGYSALTVTMWVRRLGSGTNWGRLFLNTTVNNSITITEGQDPGGVLFRLTDSGGVWHELTLPSGTLNTAWHHFTLRWDGSDMQIYEDGALAAGPIAFAGALHAALPGKGPVIGGETAAHDCCGTASWFNGEIDELRVYSRALSVAEIGQLAGLAATTKPTECNGACVDPSTDHDNCGSCGHACAAGQACLAGACASGSCP
jgi:hypothetical protein